VIAARACAGFAGLLLATFPVIAAIDLAPLWDFSRPDVSEQRFREALATAQGDDVLILHTQIARSHGLRRDFDRAREILRVQQPLLGAAGPEARARWHLEWGRSFASATHPADAVTPAARDEARRAFETALETARQSRLDALASDAIHMFAFIDPAPADQLRWGREALAVSLASDQPAARRWQASIRNNIGYALHQLGRYEEALAEFRQALALREAAGQSTSIRVAHWMIAWTLRALKRDDEALAIQLRLEREADAAGAPDPHVFEELEVLYRGRGDAQRAAHYAARRQAIAR
jgi:tetratricopeptide (TPR) repeat protein